MTSIAAHVLIAPIRFYQRFITPYTPATCRYYPTCSAYAVTALRTRGAIVGTGLTIWRLLRCNPWSSGGVDHVPPHRRADDHQDLEPHDHGQVPDAASREPDSADEWAESTSANVDPGPADQEHTDIREREVPAGSSLPASPVDSHSAGTDLDAPHSAAPEPMIGRSAA